jgi:hypothetical protein
MRIFSGLLIIFLCFIFLVMALKLNWSRYYFIKNDDRKFECGTTYNIEYLFSFKIFVKLARIGEYEKQHLDFQHSLKYSRLSL